MALQPKTVEEAGYDTIMLAGSDYQVGEHPIGLTRSDRVLHIGGEDWTLARWQQVVDRVTRLLVSERWIPDPKHNERAAGSRSSTFLSHNVDAIVAQGRGRMKKAPFWLRWLFDGVITKESLGD